MANFPYFPFYPGDWLSSLRNNCLTLEQQGGYMRLLCLCWTSGHCALPDDQRKLQKLSGLPEHALADVYEMFIAHPSVPGSITSKRLLEEWVKTCRMSEQRSQAAKKPREKRVNGCSANAQQMPNENRANAPISESESDSELEPESDIRKKKKKEKSGGQLRALPAAGVSVATWEAFADAYQRRYKVPPVRNSQVNALLCQLVRKLGVVEAPAVAAFYLTHNNPFYVAKRHPPNLLVQDAEGLRTQWATGVKATRSEVRQAEVLDDAHAQIRRVEAMLARGGVA